VRAQWVLEDAFSSRRPPLEQAGVQVVSSVVPYELCYFARLCDYTYVHEAALDPMFREFLHAYMDEEATPSLEPIPGVDLRAYKGTLIERFSNPDPQHDRASLRGELRPDPQVAASRDPLSARQRRAVDAVRCGGRELGPLRGGRRRARRTDRDR
jgi:hypothetical protein